MMENCIVLIGMPGVGKSTVGVILAKLLGYKFIDTGVVVFDIKNRQLIKDISQFNFMDLPIGYENRLLKDIISAEGVDGFIAKENHIISQLKAEKAVIATGGSVIYGREAMENLRSIGRIFYLKLDYRKLRYRLGNIKNRGVVIRQGQKLSDLYNERCPYYEKYSDVIIDENGRNIEKTVEKILEYI